MMLNDEVSANACKCYSEACNEALHRGRQSKKSWLIKLAVQIRRAAADQRISVRSLAQNAATRKKPTNL